MILKLHLKKAENILYLMDGEKIVSRSVWNEENNMSQKLLPEIDKIIKENKLKLNRVKKLEVKSDIPASYTTVRIAKTVAKTFNYAIKEGKLKPSVKRRLDRLQKETMEGKNLSPVFRTPKEMDAYLKP